MDRYPSEAELEYVSKFPVTNYGDAQKLAEFVQGIWNYADYARIEDVEGMKILDLATVGWSGNEEIVSALDKNFIFNSLCWVSSERGGGHLYVISEHTDEQFRLIWNLRNRHMLLRQKYAVLEAAMKSLSTSAVVDSGVCDRIKAALAEADGITG